MYPEEQMIIFVGRLEKIKGTHFLIRAFQLILQESPNCRLWIVGDGDYQNSFSEANPIYWISSINQNIANWYPFDAPELIEAYKEGKLKGRLNEIAAKLNEDSNPVIMLIKYKK